MNYRRQASLGHSEARPDGSPKVWDAWARVEAAFEKSKGSKPIPIKELKEVNRAGDTQIAWIYGWKDANGEADVQKVREEYEKPGTHYNPDTWVAREGKSGEPWMAISNDYNMIRETTVPTFIEVSPVDKGQFKFNPQQYPASVKPNPLLASLLTYSTLY